MTDFLRVAAASSLVCLLAACAGDAGRTRVDAGDAGPDAGNALPDAGDAENALPDAGDAGVGPGCSVDGEPGQCISTAACGYMGAGFTVTDGLCDGGASIQCCALTPNVANNPPVPAGYMLLPQGEVTPAMTSWAVMILDDPTDYPLFATATMTFGGVTVLARVEWDPPDVQNTAVHRGVTLYTPDT